MSERAAERMRRILNGTGGYQLTGESPADWEINACAAGIDGLDREMEALLSGLFPKSASEQELELWEKLFRPQVSGGSLEERREMLNQRLSMNPRRFTPREFSPMLRAAGLAGEVLEQAGGLRILAGKRLGLTEEEIRRELDEILPAHLPWEWVEEMNWAALDAWAVPFSVLDGRGLSWETLDALTKEQLEALEKEDG